VKFKRPEDPIKKALDEELLLLFQDLRVMQDTDVKRDILATTAKLYELRQKDHVSMDTVVTAATHVIGLLVVLQHERVHVIASKAFGLIKKIV